jgi:uncharacterized protein YcaQ
MPDALIAAGQAAGDRPAIRLSLAAARRIALAAQGFAEPRPSGERRTDRRHLGAVLRRIGMIQIDSVNVLTRSHYLPLFSRLGPYPVALLEEAAWGRPGRRVLFEYWGHEASIIPVATQPLMRWRMNRAERGEGVYGETARFAHEQRAYIETVLAEVRARGPLGASDLAEGGGGRSAWWGWSAGKRALEWLFWTGRVTTAGRRAAGFERLYDLPERVLPAAVLAVPTPPEDEAQRGLVGLAARAMGVATERDLRDYFRLPVADTKARIAELVAAGALHPAAVEGWDQPAYLDPEAARPRRVAVGGVLLSPFDSLIWERPRTERLFGFHFRIELYTPAAKRQHGYYVLPFLLGDQLVGRVDLKADRAASTLIVHAAYGEPGIDSGATAAALAEELRRLAEWLGLEGIRQHGRGDLAAPLADRLATR